MKKIKNILFMILILIMSVCTVAFAEENKENALYQKSLDFLIATDIVQDYTQDDIDDEVTRIEFAKIIARIAFPNGIYSDSAALTHTDVSKENKELVAALVERKIMSGYDAYIFKPNQAVSYDEVLKILVSLTGYEYKAESLGGYPVGYVSAAAQLEILDGFENRTNHSLNMGEVALLVKNTLEIDVMTMKVEGSKTVYNSDKGDTLLKRSFDLYGDKGIVRSTGDTDLYGDSNTADGCVRIGDYSYTLENDEPEKFLGHEVEFYYRAEEADSEERTLVFAYDTKDVKTLTITSKEITGFNNNTYTYTPDDQMREKEANLSSKAIVLYNYRLSIEKSGDELYLPEVGKIDMIDNDGDGKYDVVFVWDYETYVVNSVSTGTYKIGDYYGKTALNLDPDSTDSVIIKDGKQVGIDVIEKWNIISVAKSDDKNPFITVIVSDTRVTGSMDSYNSENITIDGVEYELSSMFDQQIRTGSTYDFYLDFMGNVVVYDKNSSSKDIYYGILLGYAGEDYIDLAPMIKIFGEDGVVTWYDLAEKITLDGTRISNPFDLFDVNKIDYILDENGIIPQMIAYRLNSNGEVYYIDTVVQGDKETSENMNQSDFLEDRSGHNYMLLGHTWDDDIALARGTTIFKVPAVDDSNGTPYIARGSSYDKYYEIQTWSATNPFQDGYDSYSVQFFNLNETRVSNLMIYYVPVDGSSGNYSEMMIVKSALGEAVTDDNEIVSVITGWHKGAVLSNLMLDEDVKPVLCDSTTTDETLVDSVDDLDLKPGDAIRYKLNKDGKIATIKKYWNASYPDYMISPEKNGKKAFRCVYGEITSIDREQNVILVRYQKDGADQYIVNVLRGENGNNGLTMIYNASTNRMEAGSWEDLEIGQKVMIDKIETGVRSVTIIR